MAKDSKMHDVKLSNDGWGVLLQVLRIPAGEKIERRYIKKGGQIELKIDDMLWENPRPTVDKPESEMSPIEKRKIMETLRAYDREEKTLKMDEMQRDACKKIVEVVVDAGKMPMVRALSEIMEELGIE